MAVLKVLTMPDPLLLKISQDVTSITPELKKLTEDMIDTMYAEAGIGLAAVQVGVLLRVIVVDVDYGVKKSGQLENQNPRIYINPVVVNASNQLRQYNEGCLSVPQQNVSVNRPDEVELEYLDLNFNKQSLKATGLFATCIQHEIDHLNGKTIISYASAFKQNTILKNLRKLKGLK